MENIYIVLFYIIFWKTEGCANKNNENRLLTVLLDILVYDTVRKKVVKIHDCVFLRNQRLYFTE